MSDSQWIRYQKTRKHGEKKLFCLPFAGAGAMMYAGWHSYFGPEIEVCPILLPGRETRIGEPLIDDAVEAAERIYRGIQRELGEAFAIFGHSMGGILAYELAQTIYREEGRYPEVLFLSASTLGLPEKGFYIHELEEEALIRHLTKSGGTYEELLQNKEFRECYFPIIRNDYKLSETYRCRRPKIGCKIEAFASKTDEEISYEQTLALANCTEEFEITFFQGNHFFIKDAEHEVCRKVADVLNQHWGN